MSGHSLKRSPPSHGLQKPFQKQNHMPWGKPVCVHVWARKPALHTHATQGKECVVPVPWFWLAPPLVPFLRGTLDTWRVLLFHSLNVCGVCCCCCCLFFKETQEGFVTEIWTHSREERRCSEGAPCRELCGCSGLRGLVGSVRPGARRSQLITVTRWGPRKGGPPLMKGPFAGRTGSQTPLQL